MTRIILLVFLAAISYVVEAGGNLLNENITGVADSFTNDVFIKLTDSKTYNKLVPPDGERPIHVNVSLFLLNAGTIDVQKSEFSLNLLLRISWDDNRLRQSQHFTNTLEGGHWHLERLWLPSLHVPNSKIPNVVQQNKENPLLVRIDSQGRVLVSKRLNLEGKSQMNFRLYPLDIKQITIDIESNELSSNNMRIHWNEDEPIDQSEDFTWNGYELIKYTTKEDLSNYTHTGSFSKIKANFYLQCSFEQFLLDIYLPIVLYVVISWTSFWIEITAAPARVALGLTVLLTMVTTAKSARDKLPTLAYVHSMEIWILVSTIFVFATVIEFASVNYIYFSEKRSVLKKNKRKKSFKRRERKNDPSISNITRYYRRLLPSRLFDSRRKKSLFDCESQTSSSVSNSERVQGCEERAMEIDRLCRIIFPSSYAFFNFVYWMVIVVYSKNKNSQFY